MSNVTAKAVSYNEQKRSAASENTALHLRYRQIGISAVAAAVNRRLMWRMLGAQDPLDAVTLDVACVGYLAAGDDAQAGLKSFFEKRLPAFPLKPSKDMPPFGPWAE